MSAAKPMGLMRRLAVYVGEAKVYAATPERLTPAQRRRLLKKARKAGEVVAE